VRTSFLCVGGCVAVSALVLAKFRGASVDDVMGAQNTPALVAQIDSDDDATRARAAESLAARGSSLRGWVRPLVDIWQRHPAATRTEVFYVLVSVGPSAEDAVPELIQCLDDSSFHVQYWSCRVLRAIGPSSRPAIPKLLLLAANGATSVRRNAIAALPEIAPDGPTDVVAALAAALQDPVHPVRYQAALALFRLGPHAASATTALRHTLDNQLSTIRAPAARALWHITGSANIPVVALRDQLSHGRYPWQAAAVLGEIGSEARAAVPDLVAQLDSTSDVLRFAAVDALASIGPDASEALPALQRLRGTVDDASERVEVERAIEQITY
jgi:HEAT repeat protein